MRLSVAITADLVFGRGGDADLRLDLYRPAARAASPLPVVIFLHGGGWHGGDKESYCDLAARVASCGYLCASADYRLSGDAAFPAALEDCKCAVRWLRAHAHECGADARRFGIWGHSAGGHLAAMVALTPGRFDGEGGWPHVSSVVQCALCYATPFDLAAWGRGPNVSVDHFVRAQAGDPRAAREQASPIAYVSGSAAPFFICHGEQDTLVPIEQSEQFAAALTRAGVTVEFVQVPDAGHDVERCSEDIFARAMAFLDRRLEAIGQRPGL